MKNNNPRQGISEGAELLVKDILAAPDAMHCDVLVIGSGYGGAVAAARLAGSLRKAKDGTVLSEDPIKLYVLERGNEYLPGEFPATFAELPGHVRFSLQDGKPARGNASGLFDLRLGGKVGALIGNGLGGGSLINAAVMERATADAFPTGAWPAGMGLAALDDGYNKAEAMLDLERIPGSVPKLDSLMKAGPRLGVKTQKARVAIAFRKSSRTPANVAMHPCLKCGDCVSGCNHRAKKSLDTNYLVLAKTRGARLFCGGTVYRVLPWADGADGTGYKIEFFFTDRNKGRSDNAIPYVLHARHVVLAAGTFGSTEILLRSKIGGLPVAGRALGARFSTNGDMIAVACDQKKEANSCGFEGVAPCERNVGPTITGLLRTKSKKGERPLVIEEFAIPAPLRRLLAEVVTTTDAIQGLTRFDWSLHAPDEAMTDPLAVNDHALLHTPVYGMMGDDGAGGSIKYMGGSKGDGQPMADGQVAVDWERAPDHPVFAAQMDALRTVHDGFGSLGGRLLPNPLWSPIPPFKFFGPPANLPKGSLTTVHPLGGCRMADTGETGVVDAWGRVFGSDGALLPGLAVLDGSIVPVSLGINPSLTIAALAERAVYRLAEDWALQLPGAVEPPPTERPLRRDLTHPAAPAATSVSLRERMTGEVSIDGKAFALSAVAAFAPFDVQALRTLPRTVKQSAIELRFGTGADAPVARCEGSAAMLVREKYDGLARIARSAKLAGDKLGALTDPDDASGESASDIMALCTHLGQVRLIQYDWTVTSVQAGVPLKKGDRLRLTKRIEFVKGGNPWRQLSEGVLDKMVFGFPVKLGKLVLDPSYFVEQLQPLLRVEKQQDMPNQLGDLVELGLWIVRMVLHIHVLDFLPPGDRDPTKTDERLPGRVDDLDPVPVPVPGPIDDAVSTGKKPSSGPLLSRYTPAKRREDARPVMLVHGYGASGSTFAHPAIPHNLVDTLVKAGREVWVLDLRTSIGFEGARAYYSFDEIAEYDIPAAIETIRMAYPEDPKFKLDVVAHCIGAAMFSVAVLRSDTLHERIGAVVLSQVAPLLRATAFNRFRGYVSDYLRQYIGVEHFDTRPRQLSDMLKLLVDGVLATFPYPDGDGEAEKLEEVPGFAVVRHRADAIFGQTMRLKNIGTEMLAHLDAIYGFVTVRGLSQVSCYAREQVLTDVGGQNQSVAFEALGKRFYFPVLLVHGRQNAVFDWRGAYDSFHLLKEVFDKEVPDEPPEGEGDIVMGEGTPRQLVVLAEYGHQDTLIGEYAYRDVFSRIVDFLDKALPKTPAPTDPEWIALLPWMGPILGHVSRDSDASSGVLRCRLALRPPPAHVTAKAVVFVPAWWRDGRWEFDFKSMVAAPVSREILIAEAVEVQLFNAMVPKYRGFAVLTAHDDLAFERGPVIVLGPTFLDGLFSRPSDSPLKKIDEQVRLALGRATAEQIERAVVQLNPSWTDAVQPPGQEPASSLSFALASCQYVPGLVDRVPAQASYTRLAARLRSTEPQEMRETPQLLVLTGDQVYVDQTAGLFVPAGGDDVAQAYALTFRLEALRRVTNVLPCYPLLDDHEVMDDWEPGVDPYAPGGAERAGLDAYFSQQQKLVRGRRAGTDQRPFDYTIAPGGFPFYMLDTRSTRERRAPRGAGGAKPVDEASIRAVADLGDLKDWLDASAKGALKDVPKFIVSPSPLFPLPLTAVYGGIEERLGLDDWSGYPASQLALLRMLRATRARHVVILSGDRHMSSVSSLWLEGEEPVEVISVVSSGLYAPWPFVNARPDQHWLDGAAELGSEEDPLPASMLTAAARSRDGFAVVQARKDEASGAWRLVVTLDQEDGLTRCERLLEGADRDWVVHGPARYSSRS